MVKDNAPPHKFGPGYDILGDRGAFKQYKGLHDVDPNTYESRGLDARTHSLAIRPHPHGHAIARELINRGFKKDDAPKPEDKRPLIDRVHEATFINSTGMQWFNDLYAIRMLLRKAHCFTLDAATSGMVADFSVAIAADLESVRRLAIPPFPVTWIDLDNHARLARMSELGNKLTARASGDLEGPPVDRAGWLIYEAKDIGGFYMTYFCDVDAGILAAPLSYWWHCGSVNLKTPPQDEATDFLQGMAFGVNHSNVNAFDAYITPTPLSAPLADIARDQVRDMMVELAGEMRHVWGFLLALNAGSQFGIEVKQDLQPKHNDIRTMPNNKPLLPLEHKVLHLHLRKRWTVAKSIWRAVTHHKHRWHEVRGHIRTLKNTDGTVRMMVPVKPHERGDEKLGKIVKTYKVET